MSWNADVLNKLHYIKHSFGAWQPSYRIDRKEVTLARLRIGHTFITHPFLLKGEDWPLCIPCQEPFSVKHFLLDCTDFNIIRSRFFRVNSLKELFDTVEPVIWLVGCFGFNGPLRQYLSLYRAPRAGPGKE